MKVARIRGHRRLEEGFARRNRALRRLAPGGLRSCCAASAFTAYHCTTTSHACFLFGPHYPTRARDHKGEGVGWCRPYYTIYDMTRSRATVGCRTAGLSAQEDQRTRFPEPSLQFCGQLVVLAWERLPLSGVRTESARAACASLSARHVDVGAPPSCRAVVVRNAGVAVALLPLGMVHANVPWAARGRCRDQQSKKVKRVLTGLYETNAEDYCFTAHQVFRQ